MKVRCSDDTPSELVVSAEALRQLKHRRQVKVLLQALFNLSSYAALASIGISANTLWVWLPVWWAQGVILSGFLGASHDCVHGTFGSSLRANRIAGVFWSSLVLFNFSLYRYYHLEHHKHTAVDGDTEPNGSFPSLGAYLRHMPTTAFFVSFWKMSVLALRGKFPHFVRSSRARRAVQIDNVGQVSWIIAMAFLTIRWPHTALMCYLMPMLFYFPMVFFTSLPEHYGCNPGPDIRYNTRSTYSNALFRYVFWNGNFHAEHHLYPTVPSYNLCSLNHMIGHHFVFREASYFKFHARIIDDLIHKRDSTGPDAIKKIPNPLKRVDYATYDTHRASQTTGEVERVACEEIE